MNALMILKSAMYAEEDQQCRASFQRLQGYGRLSGHVGRQPDHRGDDLLLLSGDPRRGPGDFRIRRDRALVNGAQHHIQDNAQISPEVIRPPRDQPYRPSIYSAVFGLLGRRKRSSVRKCSTISPINMKMHSSLTRRAWAMLWVTMTIV